MNERVTGMFFSPTKTTKKIVAQITKTLSKAWEINSRSIDLTLPTSREEIPSFDPQELVIVGAPVYGGRVPEVAANFFKKLDGRGAKAVATVVYGNRDYDDALLELTELLESVGFSVIAGGAFVGEHSFTKSVAAGRPDEHDLTIAATFALQIFEKIEKQETNIPLIPGKHPYKAPMAELGLLPKTSDACIACKKCARNCPMGIIDMKDPRNITEGCLGCCACVKGCPQNAKYFDSETFLQFRTLLETNCSTRKEPRLFLF